MLRISEAKNSHVAGTGSRARRYEAGQASPNLTAAIGVCAGVESILCMVRIAPVRFRQAGVRRAFLFASRRRFGGRPNRA
jgi:hypothetical protein